MLSLLRKQESVSDQLLANQPDIIAVDKNQKTAIVIDGVVPSESNIRKKEKLQKSYKALVRLRILHPVLVARI